MSDVSENDAVEPDARPRTEDGAGTADGGAMERLMLTPALRVEEPPRASLPLLTLGAPIGTAEAGSAASRAGAPLGPTAGAHQTPGELSDLVQDDALRGLLTEALRDELRDIVRAEVARALDRREGV